MSIPKRIRPISICLFYNNGKILATKAFDEVKKETFYRSIGGGIEFGESGIEAIEREVTEELGVEIENIKELGIFESIFVYNGKQGHEFVMVFDADFKDKNFYNKNEIKVTEGDLVGTAYWLTIEEIINKKVILYPESLPKLLKEKFGGFA